MLRFLKVSIMVCVPLGALREDILEIYVRNDIANDVKIYILFVLCDAV